MIELESVTFNYGPSAFALAVPRLHVGAGEIVAVVGPSGSGKTTLLNLIAEISLPESGRVFIDDTAISEFNDAARRDYRIAQIGCLFQDFCLLEYLTVLDNILHPYRISGALVLDRQVRERALALADSMGLGDKLKRHPDALSQGEQQRAAICRALLPEPKLILADEATGNLDPDNKSLILDLLFERVEARSATLLAVTHDHELLPRFDRVVDFHDFRASGA